jgi:hypothetical protein
MSKKHRKAKVNYRKIWKEHYGNIPKDENGISYHIHHIDGNPENNEINNLKAISADEHARIHENDFILWASVGHKFWTTEGKEKRANLARVAGLNNYKNKVGIFDPTIKKTTDELNSKQWRIISPSRNIDTIILSLNKWCEENKVSRSGMNCAYIENRPYDDYYLLQIDKDTSIENKYKPKIHKNSKKHKIIKENGEILEVINLSKWCKDNKINREGLKTASYRGSFYKGFKLWFSLPKLTGEKPI